MILLRKVTTADGSVVKGQMHVKTLFWQTPVSVSDTCVVQDGAGNEIITLVCEVASQSQVVQFPDEGLFIKPTGIKISTLASGDLYIYGSA